jgi:hypothetical protein
MPRLLVAALLAVAACARPAVIVLLVPTAPHAGSAIPPAPSSPATLSPLGLSGSATLSTPSCSIESIGADGTIACIPSSSTGTISVQSMPGQLL